MSSDRGRRLSHDDRLLWSTVARTVTPLAGRKLPEMPVAEPLPDLPPEQKSSGMPAFRPRGDAQRQPRGPFALDAPTRKKLSKGRLALDGSIDLHGMTQAEAHSTLLGFLHRAYHEGRRHVLVVTGKGASFGSDGVLRRAVPAWLSTPAFRGLVSGYEDAARRHGGEGAIYIRLRRRTEPGT
jgi:DNA-nicking Smr family endonuclease